MSNVVISGYYGSRNAGDEAMLAAMVEVLSDLDPKVNITVISANPQDTRQRHGVKAVGWLDLAGILGALRHGDILLSGGGSRSPHSCTQSKSCQSSYRTGPYRRHCSRCR